MSKYNYKTLFIPLLILSFNINVYPDNLSSSIIHSWNINKDASIDSAVVDTIWSNFQVMNPIYKNEISNTFLGGIGTPSQSNNFFNKYNSDCNFLNLYKSYYPQPYNILYYNTKKPFTNVQYTSSIGNKEKLEQTLKILHTQNIDPLTNAGFSFYNINDIGNFKSQWVDDRSDNYFRKKTKLMNLTLFSSHQSDYYLFHGNIIINAFGPNEEIGGILYDTTITDTLLNTEDIRTNFLGASSQIRNQNVYFIHELKFGHYYSKSDSNKSNGVSAFGLIHELKMVRANRIYIDKGERNYYLNAMFDTTYTHDSVYYRSIKNSVRFKLNENPYHFLRFGGYAGFSMDFNKFTNPQISDTIVTYNPVIYNSFDNMSISWQNNDTLFISYSDTSFFENRFEGYGYIKLKDNVNLSLLYNLVLSGYKSGDLSISPELKTKMPLGKKVFYTDIKVGRTSETPSYFYQNFTSNHYSWRNTLEREKREWANIKMYLDTSIISLEGNYTRIRNYTYLNRSTNPEQHKGAINILSGELNFNFRLGQFYLLNKALCQYTNANDSVLSLPLISLYNSTYYQFSIVKNVLSAQTGFDIYYNTKYFIPAYDPALGQFYLQNIKKYGEYPYINVFINAKWKRVRLFFMLENALAGLSFTNNNYLSAFNYPRNFRNFKLGISWSFYN